MRILVAAGFVLSSDATSPGLNKSVSFNSATDRFLPYVGNGKFLAKPLDWL